jgi:hypothetical protein
MADKLKKVSKAHVRYKLADGTVVPGATTITGLLNKPFLVTWANRLGLEGIDSTKYRDAAAEVGTLAHQMIQDYLQGEQTDFSNYSKEQISLAENAVLSFFEWEKGHKIEPIICESPLVSERYKFGGTVDCYCFLDGVPTLLDFKTGKAIYDEYFVQLAGYKALLEEHGHEVKSCHILRVGRDETEGFEDRTVTNLDTYFEIFQNLLNVYYAKKKVGWR